MNPPNGVNASIVYHISTLYKQIYISGKKLNKGDKLGIRATTERVCLRCLRLSVKSALTAKDKKLPFVEKLKIELEVLKQMIRIEMEVCVTPETDYFEWQEKLQEISRMTAGWIQYLQKKEPSQDSFFP